jgi:hypothetical protein
VGQGSAGDDADSRMRRVLTQLALTSNGRTSRLDGNSGGGSSRHHSDALLVGWLDPLDAPQHRYVALYMRGRRPTPSARRSSTSADELDRIRISRGHAGVAETLEELYDRIVAVGEGWPARDVANSVRTSVAIVRRARKERGRDQENGQACRRLQRARPRGTTAPRPTPQERAGVATARSRTPWASRTAPSAATSAARTKGGPLVATLADRVLEHLRSEGPDFTVAIGQALGVRDAHVAGALTNLKRRELVAESHRSRGLGGHDRVYYRAVHGQRVPSAAPAAVPSPPSLYLDELRRESALMRAAYPVVELEALILSNRPPRGM